MADILIRLLTIGITNGAILALNAIAVTLVYGAVRMINFAHGDLFALTSVIVVMTVTALGLHQLLSPWMLLGGLLLALLAACAFAIALNVAIERLAFRPFRNSSRLAPLIAGIAISFVFYQGALLLRRLERSWIPIEHRSVPGLPEVPHDAIPDLLPQINLTKLLGLPFRSPLMLKDLLVVLAAIALALGVTWLLHRTRIGRALQACAQDPEMAQLCGVNRNRAIATAFALGGLLAGAAAFIFVLYYTHPFTLYGAQSGLTAFAAAVLGGIGSPLGALGGGLVLGIISSFSDYYLAAQWTPVVSLLILILLLLLRPGGLSGDGDQRGPVTELVAGYHSLNRQRSRWINAGLIALAVAYPLLDMLFGLRQQVVVTSLLVFALLALGLNLLLGFAGLLDLGYAAYFAVGGYTAALLGSRLNISDGLLVLVMSALVAALFAALNGALTLRLRSDELAIATMAFGQIITRSFLNLDEWTGGARGIAALPTPRLLGIPLATPIFRYYWVLAIVLLVVLGAARLLSSRIGRSWRAIAEDETAAASSGVNPSRSRMSAFVLGGAIAGMAGGLFASIFSYMDPNQSDFRISAMALAMVVIGGAGSIRGAIIGAFLVAGYDSLLIPLLGAWLNQVTAGTALEVIDLRALSFLSFGVALYLTIFFRARERHRSLTS